MVAIDPSGGGNTPPPKGTLFRIPHRLRAIVRVDEIWLVVVAGFVGSKRHSMRPEPVLSMRSD